MQCEADLGGQLYSIAPYVFCGQANNKKFPKTIVI